MTTERVDYVVVGASPAGMAAALELSRAASRVVMLDYHRDTDTLVDLPFVQENALTPRLSGAEFASVINDALRSAGIERRSDCYVAKILANQGPVVICSDRSYEPKGVIFAPLGTEPGLDLYGASELHGFGVSYSAAADAPFFASRRVAIYGDGPRLIEHAWIAARFASHVAILATASVEDADPLLLADLQGSRAVALYESVLLTNLHSSYQSVQGVEIQMGGVRKSLEVASLFVAHNLVADTSVVRNARSSAAIRFAGLAAGVPYWRHAALVDDGFRAASTMLAGVES